jgi:hypothetical protein
VTGNGQAGTPMVDIVPSNTTLAIDDVGQWERVQASVMIVVRWRDVSCIPKPALAWPRSGTIPAALVPVAPFVSRLGFAVDQDVTTARR